MKKKKIKRSTFSTCPSWKNNKQRAEFENKRHIQLKDNAFLERMEKMFPNIF